MVQEIKSGYSWSRAQKLAVRRMYLIQGLSPSEIGKKMDRDNNALHCLISKNGWAKQRRQKELLAASQADEAATDAAREFVESVAINAQELTEKSFHLAHSTDDAKELAYLSSSAKNWVGLARFGLNLEPGAQAQSGGISLSVVFAPLRAVEKPLVSVTPIHDSVDLDLA